MGEFDFSVILDNLPFLIEGLGMTFLLTLLAIAGGLTIGTLLALARLSAETDQFFGTPRSDRAQLCLSKILQH